MVAPSPAEQRPIAMLGTTLGRARCQRPALVERMRQSLSAQGQLQPMVAVDREGKLELVDGFKRREAATALGWPTLMVRVMPLDEAGQWVTMLALNRGPLSMTELEEALVLRELAATGLTQVQIAQMLQRHKSWVSRRIGLVERLHPELGTRCTDPVLLKLSGARHPGCHGDSNRMGSADRGMAGERPEVRRLLRREGIFCRTSSALGVAAWQDTSASG